MRPRISPKNCAASSSGRHRSRMRASRSCASTRSCSAMTAWPPRSATGASAMKVSFIAGFGPIIRDPDDAHAFWRDGLGIAFEEPAPGYFTNDDLEGVKAFAMWPLSQAAEATFGSTDWPGELPVPQAWLELDVPSAEAVAEAIEELRGA